MDLLVVTGAYYLVDDMIVKPHFTGEFGIVDCTRYLKREEILNIYNEEWLEDADWIVYEDEKYYYAEYSPTCVDKDWELISDLSDLKCDFTGFI